MEYKVYGHDGQALLAFPCQDGRYYDWENYHMIDVLAPFIEAGRLRVITVDGIDWETWTNHDFWDKRARIEHHESWFRYVTDELLPNLRHNPEQMFITTGASMGGFHAANFFFRRPDLSTVCCRSAVCTTPLMASATTKTDSYMRIHHRISFSTCLPTILGCRCTANVRLFSALDRADGKTHCCGAHARWTAY